MRYVDIDLESGNLSTALLNQELLKTKAGQKKIICPVHFSGNPVDISAILQKNTLILEDAAHAFGASDLQGKKIGGCHFSEMTIFSFHPAKSITTGEGGAVVTNRQDLYRRLCEFRNNGIVRGLPNSEYPGYYDVAQITGNYNFTDFQAALGLSQLSKLDFFIEKRRKLVRVYREILGNTPFVTLFDPSLDPFSAHHLMVVQIAFDHFEKSRANVMEELKKRGIGTQVHYRSLDRHTAIDKRKTLSPLPKMELYYREALTLPLYYELTEEDVAMICDQLFETLGIR